MDLIGVDQHEFSRIQGILNLIHVKFNLSFEQSKDFDRTMPVLLSRVITASSLENKHFKRDIVIWHNNLV